MEFSKETTISPLIEPERQVSKKELRIAMGFNPRTFTKKITALESDIKKMDHHYKKTDVTLNPRVARFIIDELGFDIIEIRRIMNAKPTPRN